MQNTTNVIDAIRILLPSVNDRNIKLLYTLKFQKFLRQNNILKIENLFNDIVKYLKDDSVEPTYDNPPSFLQAGLDFISFLNKNIESLPEMNDMYENENEKSGKEKGKKRKEKEKEKIKNDIEMAIKGNMILCTSPCQGGKSNFTICCAIKSMLSGKTPIIVTRNLSADSIKMGNDIALISQKFNDFMIKNNVEKKFEITTLTCKKLDSEKFHKSLRGEYPRIIICLANNIQLHKVYDTLKDIKGQFDLYIDEIDYVDYGNSDVSEYLDKLKKLSSKTYAITATPLDCLLSEEELKASSNVRIKPHADYRGYHDFIVKALDIDADVSALNKISSYEEIIESDKNLKPYLESFCESKLSYAPKLDKFHPNICLLKNTYINENQDALFNGLINDYGDKVAVVVYNGKGIAMNYDGMQNIKIKNIVVKPKKYSQLEIPDVLQYFKNTNEKKFKRIIIISGIIAGRCISFVSRDYEWHLTDMYYVPANSTPVPELIQSAGRLCGRNKGKSHLILNCTLKVARALYNGLNFTYETMNRAIDEPLKNEEGIEQSFKKSVLNVPMLRSKLPPGRDLTTKIKIKKNDFNIVKENDGGFDKKDYEFTQFIKDIKENKETKEKVINDLEEIGVEEYNRLTKKMFPKWSKGDSKISKFMQNLDPNKEYNEKEIKELCKNVGIERISQLLSYNKSGKGFGNIIYIKNDKYKLYSCLLSDFKKYF